MKSISIINGNCEISNDDPLLFSLEKCLEDDVHVNNYDKDEISELITDDNVTEESFDALLLDNREVIKPILKEVNFCSECENNLRNLRNSDLPVYIQQIIRMTNKLLKTRAHRRNILKIILEFFES